MASPTAAPGQYPEQLVNMVTPEVRARIVVDARRHQLSKSEVAREYLEAGIAAADAMADPEALAAVEAEVAAEVLRRQVELDERAAAKRKSAD